MKKRTLSLLIVLCLSIGLLAGCGQSAPVAAPSENSGGTPSVAPVEVRQFTCNLGSTMNASLYKGVLKFKEKLEELSAGSMIVNINCDSSYKESLALDELMNDNVDFTYLASSSASTTVKEVAYLSMAGCYSYVNGYQDTTSLPDFQNAIKDDLNDIFADYNIKFLALRVPSQAAIGMSKVDVKKPEDLSGKIMRVAGTYHGKLFDSMKIATANLAMAEVATGIQRGTVDGCFTGDEQMVNNMIYEVCRYVTVFPSVDSVGSFVACLSTWDSLNDQQKKWVEEASEYYLTANLAERKSIVEANNKIMTDGGCSIYNLTREEANAFTKYNEQVYSAIDSTVNQKGLKLKESILSWQKANGLA